MNGTKYFLASLLIVLSGIFWTSLSVSAQQFAKTYTPRKPTTSGSSFWRTRNIETKGVCAVGGGEYAVVSTLEVEVSPNDWQTTGQVMIIDENGVEMRSKTYYTGLPAPLSQIKFNNVAYIPANQLDIFRKTIDTMDTLIVPTWAKQKVRFFTSKDSNIPNDSNLRLRGVLLIAGARRPLYPVDKGGVVYYEICDNYQAAYYAIDVATLDTLTTGSFACNMGRDTNNANWESSEYHSLRFEYQGYIDTSGNIKQTAMRQRVAFVGSAMASTGNLSILASRSDLYYIATGINYNAVGYMYPSFITRTFRSSAENNFKDEEGLDIDMRYRDVYEDKDDWTYAICGYSKAQYIGDTTERAISFTVNDTLEQAPHHTACVKGGVWVLFGDNRSSRATAVTWVAPQNDINSEVRWFNASNNGYVVAGSRQRDARLRTESRTFVARLPLFGLYAPKFYVEYGLGIPDTISSHPGYSILSRTIAVDSTPGNYEAYNFYITGWWNDLNEANPAPTARWLQLNDDLTVAGGNEYMRTQPTINYGNRMCRDNNDNGFVIAGTMGLNSSTCDTNYKGGGFLTL